MKTLPNQTASESAPDEAHSITKPATPKLYLAGKIGGYFWREAFVPNLRGHLWADGPIHTEAFVYVGPFFTACSHGCEPQPNTHGAAGSYDACQILFTQHQVIEFNSTAIATADLILAYVTAADCYGTLCEIGYALGKGKRVIAAFAPNIPAADFWFSALQCHAVYNSVRLCCLKDILADEIQKMTRLIGGGRRASC